MATKYASVFEVFSSDFEPVDIKSSTDKSLTVSGWNTYGRLTNFIKSGDIFTFLIVVD
jgi:hypothetical protein